MSPLSLCVTLGMFLNFLYLWGLLCNMENCNSPHRLTMGIKHTGIKELRELLENGEHSINTYLHLRNVVISNTGFSVHSTGNGTKYRVPSAKDTETNSNKSKNKRAALNGSVKQGRWLSQCSVHLYTRSLALSSAHTSKR